MTLETAVYSAAVVFVAYLVRGVAGFGSGLIAVPLLTLISPVTAVVPVVVSLDYIASASQSVRNLDDIAWREQVVLLPFMLIGILGGLYLLTVVPTWVLAKTLGVFVIAFGIYQLLPLRPARGSRIAATYCGILGGLLGTLFGTGGPFYAIYLNLRAARSDHLPGHLRAELPDRRRGPAHRLRRPGPPLTARPCCTSRRRCPSPPRASLPEGGSRRA